MNKKTLSILVFFSVALIIGSAIMVKIDLDLRPQNKIVVDGAEVLQSRRVSTEYSFGYYQSTYEVYNWETADYVRVVGSKTFDVFHVSLIAVGLIWLALLIQYEATSRC